MANRKATGAHSPAFKARAVERMRAGENVSALARELKVRRKLLYEWKQVVETGQSLRGRGRPAGRAGSRKGDAGDVTQRIQELEALVGRLTLENRFFKGALQNIEELRRRKSENSSAASSLKSKSKGVCKAN